MKNNGLSDSTIKTYDKALTYLSKHADLNNPEQVKQFIANKQTSNSYRRNLSLAYDKYCNYYQIEWNKPFYKQEPKMIRIPSTTQIEMLIANAGRINSAKLTVSKETGLRPIELCNLKVKDIDIEQRIIYPTTAKHGAPRALKISNSLTATLQRHISEHNLNPNDKLFKGDSDNYGKHFRLYRNKLAEKLNKPELKSIRLYDFRHYFASRLYAKTRDILLVKQQMGHKKIETTLIYTQLLNLHEDDEWTCKATTNTKQATELIENGFEYVTTTPDALMLFRKRK
ncbi:site-specific integrase [Candidatus Bathyarchaeota archaeon]|nr:MAG: site-specific integrase [Candidatus Bathyarchaeota archaeon]